MHTGDDIPNKVSLSVGDDHLIKVIASYAGEFCYIDNLVTSLTHSEPKEIEPRPPLRRIYHNFFTVLGSGAFHRSKKPSPYKNSDADEKKKYLSRAQSTTLITQHKHPTPYDAPSSKTPPEVGVILDPKDALFNRFFLTSQRTWERRYEFNTKREAEEYYELTKNNFLFDNYDDFKNAVEDDTRDRCNEVLARVRWNPTSCGIAIFNDTLEARLVAQIYAKKIKEALLAKSGKLPESIDNDYEVPIYHYSPKDTEKHFTEYTAKQQLDDINLAKNILNNPKKTQDRINDTLYAFLHFADNPADILQLRVNNRPLIIELIRLKLFHIANDLVKRAGEESLSSYLEKNNLSNDAAGQFKVNDQCLINAVKHGRFDLAEIILSIAPHLANTTDEKERTPLNLSVINKFDVITHRLLSLKCVNEQEKNIALSNIFSENYFSTIKYLLEKNYINPNVKINQTPLIMWATTKIATENNKFSKIDQDLLSDIQCGLANHSKINLSAINSINENILFTAVRFKENKFATWLARQKINVNQVNIKGETALMIAARNNQTEIVLALLENGADTSLKDNQDNTALDLAKKYRHKETMNVLLEYQEKTTPTCPTPKR